MRIQPCIAINFKNTLNKKEKADIDYKLRTKNYKKQDKVNALAIIAGVGIGAISKLAGKNSSFNKGIYGYFASLFAFTALDGVKNAKKSKDFYKDYEQNYEYKNGFDKFIGSLAIPEAVDLGDEEKNRQYYETYKKERSNGIKMSLLALSTGAVTGIICTAKKIPDKFDKIAATSIITAAASLVGQTAINTHNEKSSFLKF